MDLFPEGQAEGLEVEKWDLSGPLPIPTWDLACPVCGAKRSEGAIIGRAWKFHTRQTATPHPWRCDVSFKCASCAAVWAHGVVVPIGMYQAREQGSPYDWRAAKALLGG